MLSKLSVARRYLPHRCRILAKANSIPARTISQGELLWQPTEERVRQSAMKSFAEAASRECKRDLSSWPALHAWSVTETAKFWALVARFVGLKWREAPAKGGTYTPPPSGMRGAKWFRGGKLNFAENLLPAPTNREVLVSIVEGPEGPVTLRLTGEDLYIEVARCAAALRAAGVKPGDRVAGVVANASEAVICMLGTTAIGAIWSSCSPDFGAAGVVDRLGQVAPKVVFFSTAYRYNGKRHDPSGHIAQIMEKMPPQCVAVTIPSHADVLEQRREAPVKGCRTVPFSEFLDSGGVTAGPGALTSIDFEPGDFGLPVFIMFTSGTTGLPKCMVHGAGGTLLNMKKELILHSDVGKDSRLLYYTTTGWMMWNWMAATLSVPGATLVTYDGSPAWPQISSLWQLAEQEQLTHLGLSPKYIAACMAAGASPMSEGLPLPHLRTLLSTGSPLLPEHFSYVYSHVKQDVHLASISGGTDILGCFVLGNPTLPVRAGEIQCCGLGMDVVAYDESLKRAVTKQKAELVCRTPFPSMPVCFWNDPEGAKYDAAYFRHLQGESGANFSPFWHHGDYIEMTNTGVVIHGRSDSTLNPGGVRIGTAEIYRQLHEFPEVSDAVAVGWRVNGDVEVTLLVKMAAGAGGVSEELRKRVRSTIRASLTPRHVPKHILEVNDIPYTRSGKIAEVAAVKALHGEPVHNTTALANPESLSEIGRVGRELAAAQAADIARGK